MGGFGLTSLVFFGLAAFVVWRLVAGPIWWGVLRHAAPEEGGLSEPEP